VFLYNKLLYAKPEADKVVSQWQIRSVEEAGTIAKGSEIHLNVHYLKFNLKEFVKFSQHLVLKVSCLVSVSIRSSLSFVSTFCSKFRSRLGLVKLMSRLGLEDFGLDASSVENYKTSNSNEKINYSNMFKCNS